ncbi:MAG: asparagine synthase (glutamine-hydrolyzing) [Lachnospiraceae bacterium]|nr:asparagine synthase (glutamine-hydrolyzing) [Lachnospiraceae bacterium]
MCGIAGLINYGSKAKTEIEVMKQRMRHRGPDSDGTWCADDADVTFGHVRLAILDLSETGAQPMTSHDGRFTIVFNGEIYNHRVVRKALAEKGVVQFRGTSDTEVLLEAFSHIGIEKTLTMCKGMFAFALYDRQEKTITFARDRVGEKPLYYGFVNGAFVFASDLGAIRTLSAFRPVIDESVLGIYFRHGYIPAPYTIYKGICKLQPGCIMTLRAPFAESDVHMKQYWSMRACALYGRSHPFTGTFEEASAELEKLLKASVADQMVADVPVGAFLSGGIDSATTVSLMQSISPGKVKSFTIGMEDKSFDEAVYAKEIAAHLGTEHTELYITEQDAKDVIPLLPRMFSEPFADSSQIPTYLVSRMTREHVTVSLSGDAGDELFAGYNSYTEIQRTWNRIRGIPHPLRVLGGGVIGLLPIRDRHRKDLVSYLLKSKSPEALYRGIFESDPLIRAITLKQEIAPYAYSQEICGDDVLGDPIKDTMLMDLSMYHPDDILVKVDRCAMAVTLESRVPMLDRDVVEFAWTLPLSYLREGGKGKRVLRDVLYRHVPREMMERKKTGFAIPIMKWLKEDRLREWAEELLSEKRLREQGLLNVKAVRTIWDDFLRNDRWRVPIWFLLMFEAWYGEEYEGATWKTTEK